MTAEEEKTVVLTKEERLELHNLDLRRQILEIHSGKLQQDMLKLEKEQAEAVALINERIGDDIKTYRINLDTGEAIKLPPS